MTDSVSVDLRRLEEAMRRIRAAGEAIRAVKKNLARVQRRDPKAKTLPKGRSSSTAHRKSGLLEFRAKKRK